MRAKFAAVLAGSALEATLVSGATANGIERNALEELSLDELLALRESILEAKHNLTYVIEESDGDEDYDSDEFEDGIAGEFDDYDDEDYDDEDAEDEDEDENEKHEDVHEVKGIIDEMVAEVKKADEAKKADETKKADAKKDQKREVPEAPVENLLALRDELIQEIRGHMHHHQNNVYERENLTYDLAEGHNITLTGSMNGVKPRENILYELSEGPNARLKGSMNDADLSYHLLSLR